MADDGSVIEVVTRARMRAERLSHRCTYVVVVVSPRDRFAGSDDPPELHREDEVVVHLRADWKDVAPSHWDLAFGGVCGAGEDWVTSARRELSEEAGIDLDVGAGPGLDPDPGAGLGRDRLIDLGPTRFDEPGVAGRPGPIILGWSYLVAWPHEPISTDGEAVAFDRVRLGDLPRWLDSVPVCPDSAQVLVPRLLDLVAPPPGTVL